ncbi:hypothetical protein [Athalassotoga saccharophila]|uniref:hypothetical protein n=1 Tax=Athalassotoga saccharophila TaxID=1441386 RepID=UPI001E651C1C|nr:hypothetical protein [Athalassotoga saccharophila]
MNSSNIQDLPKNEQLKVVSAQFVSLLLSEVFNEMEKGIYKSNLVPDQFGESWYRQWLMDIYAQDAAGQNFGQLVKLVETQISKNPYKELPDRTENFSTK